MARSLHNKVNTVAPSSDYPYGRIRDKIAGLQSGTPVNENVYGDFHQFFSRLMAEAGIEENGNPDNDYTGFQLYQALLKTIAKKVGQYSNGDELTPSTPTNLNSFIYPGIFNVDAYTLSNDPGLDGPGQLIVGGNPDGAGIQRLIDLSNGAEWKRTMFAGVSFGSWTLLKLGTYVAELGTWDMDSTITISKSIPFDFRKIRKIGCVVRDDTNSEFYDLCNAMTSTSFVIPTQATGAIAISNLVSVTNTVYFSRLTGGFFDGANYASTSNNRGWFTIEYDPSN